MGTYLYWTATEPITQSLKVFVHLFGPRGDLIAQHDSVPALWTYPAEDWRAGETVVDFHWMHVPADTPAGTYTLSVGMYEETTGERWPVLDASGQVSSDHVNLAQVDLD